MGEGSVGPKKDGSDQPGKLTAPAPSTVDALAGPGLRSDLWAPRWTNEKTNHQKPRARVSAYGPPAPAEAIEWLRRQAGRAGASACSHSEEPWTASGLLVGRRRAQRGSIVAWSIYTQSPRTDQSHPDAEKGFLDRGALLDAFRALVDYILPTSIQCLCCAECSGPERFSGRGSATQTPHRRAPVPPLPPTAAGYR